MILMEIFSYVIDALLIYVFYDKYFSKERRREFASTAVIWGAFAMMEGINYVFNTPFSAAANPAASYYHKAGN